MPRPTGIGVYTEALLGELLETREFALVGLAHAPLHPAVGLAGRGLAIEVHRAPPGGQSGRASRRGRVGRGEKKRPTCRQALLWARPMNA